MSVKLFRREEDPVPSGGVKAAYAVYLVLVLSLYFITILLNDRRPGQAAELIKGWRTAVCEGAVK